MVEGAEESLVLEDVVVGDVWVLGGQSNMEFNSEVGIRRRGRLKV
jgi:hypothetical protein